jgi:hypothetical protein
MSLYLTIFDGEEEITGWVFGHYSDFGYFRDTIAEVLDEEEFLTLMRHSDCDGQWSPGEQVSLRRELLTIGAHFKKLPPRIIEKAFEHTAEHRAKAANLYDCFHNVDGENVFEALIALCDEGIRHQHPILFQ